MKKVFYSCEKFSKTMEELTEWNLKLPVFCTLADRKECDKDHRTICKNCRRVTIEIKEVKGK